MVKHTALAVLALSTLVGCHGMTLGELGHWFIAHYGLDVDYRVIDMHYWLPEAGPGFGWPMERLWINPSPNAPNLNMARAYAGTVMVEGATLSEGRGTTRPLELFGAPDIDARAVIANPDIDIVIELIGGYGIAKALVLEAIAAGKHVVTADNGIPGRILACANGLSLGSTGIVSASVTARMIRPGWYYALFNADSSTAVVRGSAFPLPNFLGSLASNERTIRHWTRSRTYASYTLGDDAMSGSSG